MLLTVNVAYEHWLPLPRRLCNGETENASTENVSRRDGIRKYGKPKYEVARVENVSMENSSMDMHGWNTKVRKTQVHVCSDRKRKYENRLSDVDMTGK